MDNNGCQDGIIVIMRETTTRPWRGVSAEERRAERRERLIAAGVEVIGTSGWTNTSVRQVCDEAGMIARYFYEAFPDREALLLAVFEHVAAQGTRVVVDAFTHAPTLGRAKVRAPIAAFFEWLTDDPRMGRILLSEGLSEERLQQQRHDVLLTASTVLAGLATSLLDDEQHADPTDVTLSALALVGAETELATAYLAGRLDVTRERLIEHITELHLALIGVSSTAPLRQGTPRSEP